jgi:hypothetical protein
LVGPKFTTRLDNKMGCDLKTQVGNINDFTDPYIHGGKIDSSHVSDTIVTTYVIS